ncbi:MAG: hypothetical protein ACFFE8_15215 [Candidatus Heimdallarchaeota archaeon]
MPATLRFILIYREDGIPIYAKCYTEFCSSLFTDTARLTSFLSSLEIMSRKVSGNQPISSMLMGNITIKFFKSLPSCHSVVLGLESHNEELFDGLFQAISILLEQKYPDKDWSIVDRAFNAEFSSSIVKNALMPVFHGFEITHDECELGTACPLYIIGSLNKGDKSIWKLLKEHTK